jgi:hypothetical protein
MIQIRMMNESDMQPLYADPALKRLLLAEAWGDTYCIVAEENGEIVGGLSGSVSGDEAALQVCAAGGAAGTSEAVLTEGLVRSILYVLDKRGVVRAYMVMDVNPAIAEKIGFTRMETLPEWIKPERKNGWSIDIKTFLAQDCCGCGGKRPE